MYDSIKQALGPIQKKSAPLKSATGVIIQDRAQQMEHWVQHNSELYSRENVVTEEDSYENTKTKCVYVLSMQE